MRDICGLQARRCDRYTAPVPIHSDRILYEDAHLLIVNKLPSELVVAASGEGKLPLFDFLKKDYPGLRVLHRLDFGTSGVIAFARSAEVVAKVRISKFGGWKKYYHALVAGRMTRREGTIRKPLRARTHEGMVEAVTHYAVLATFRDATYVEARIETGRKHQIRQHFAGIGHPLLLDPLYGDKKADRAFARRFHYHRFFLHASSLTLLHPITGEIVRVAAPLPKVFAEAVERLQP